MILDRHLEWGGPAAPLQLDRATPIPDAPTCSVISRHIRDLADGHVGFHGWLCAVNVQCQATDQLNLFDLPPRAWREEYDGRVPPDEAADVALDEFASVHGLARQP
jgi:hypothetical protein